jgi:hypothetical protein
MEPIPCRFAEKGCQSEAAEVIYVPQGCHCWPDPVQALCEQHLITAESDGPITLVKDLRHE